MTAPQESDISANLPTFSHVQMREACIQELGELDGKWLEQLITPHSSSSLSCRQTGCTHGKMTLGGVASCSSGVDYAATRFMSAGPGVLPTHERSGKKKAYMFSQLSKLSTNLRSWLSRLGLCAPTLVTPQHLDSRLSPVSVGVSRNRSTNGLEVSTSCIVCNHGAVMAAGNHDVLQETNQEFDDRAHATKLDALIRRLNAARERLLQPLSVTDGLADNVSAIMESFLNEVASASAVVATEFFASRCFRHVYFADYEYVRPMYSLHEVNLHTNYILGIFNEVKSEEDSIAMGGRVHQLPIHIVCARQRLRENLATLLLDIEECAEMMSQGAGITKKYHRRVERSLRDFDKAYR